MVAVVTILTAFPLGYFIKDKVIAYLVFMAVFAQVYTFQTADGLMQWVKGNGNMFDKTAGDSTSLSSIQWDYLVVTSVIYLIGFGLVTLGRRVRTRRSTKRSSVDLGGATA